MQIMTWDDIFGIMESHPVHTEHVDNLANHLDMSHNTTAGINGLLYLHSRYCCTALISPGADPHARPAAEQTASARMSHNLPTKLKDYWGTHYHVIGLHL